MVRLSLIIVCIFTVTHGLAGEAETFKQENKPENLKAFFELLHKTTHTTKDNKSALALFKSTLPDESRTKIALKDDLPEETFQKVAAFHKSMPMPTEATVATLSKAAQTTVGVVAATTEEIAKYEKGTHAFQSFPSGAQRVALAALKPGMTFYEVSFVEPGQTAGMKYHLLFWDGKSWTMLGPVWRALK